MKIYLEWAVFPGSEKIDLGDKRAAVFCSSPLQAAHMATFWGPHGYFEELAEPIVVELDASRHSGTKESVA